METLHQRPHLAGRLSREDKGPKAERLKLTYEDEEHVDLRFSISDLTDKPEIWQSSYEELRQQGMPIRELDPALLMPPGGYELTGSSPFVARASFIPGGCLLVVCLNHSFVDGLGGAMVVETWAKNCKDAQSSEYTLMHMGIPSREDNIEAPEPIQLPDILQDSTAPQGEELTMIQENDRLWQLLGLQKHPINQHKPWAPPSSKVMVSAIFVASAESIPRLKAKSAPLRDENDRVPTTYVSSFDAIAALIWRSIIKARYPELKEQGSAYSRLRIPVNLRQVLDVPPEYPGNVLLNSVAEMPIKSLTAGSSQRQVALEIRSSLIASRDPSLVRDSIKLSFVLPSLDSRRPLFSDTTEQDLVLTSWLDLSYLKHEWGPIFGPSGNAEFFRVPNGFLRGICALQPRGVEDTIEILVNLEEGQMKRLMRDTDFLEHFALKAF